MLCPWLFIEAEAAYYPSKQEHQKDRAIKRRNPYDCPQGETRCSLLSILKYPNTTRGGGASFFVIHRSRSRLLLIQTETPRGGTPMIIQRFRRVVPCRSSKTGGNMLI